MTSTAGVLTIAGGVSDGGGNFGISKGGLGMLALLGTNTYTGVTSLVNSGNLRVSGPEGIATTPVFLNGGCLEVGGSLTNLTLGNGPGQIRWNPASNGGLSVDTGTKQVSLNSNAPLTWGQTNFLTGGGIFILSTAQSTGTIDFTNSIDLAGADRRISVRNGGAPLAPDAILSGVLSNGTISLQGGGTLFVNNINNTLTGAVTLAGGTLRVPSMSYLPNSNIIIDSGSNLEVGENTTLTLGTMPGQVSFAAGGGGFSSYGKNTTVTVNDGASPGTPLVWGGTASFLAAGPFVLASSSSDATTTFSSPIDLNGAARTISAVNGAALTDGNLTGQITGGAGSSLIVSGGGALQLSNETNSYAGATSVIGNSTLVLTEIANGGLPSSIGSSSSDASNLVLTAGGIRYIGDGSTTDRLLTFGATFSLTQSGTGPLTFTNPGAYVSAGTASARTLNLSGISKSTAELSGVIPDSGASLTSVTKAGIAPWILSGNNSYNGLTTVNNGTLTFDFSQGRVPLSAGQVLGTSGITIENGTVAIKGNSFDTTNVSIVNLRFSNGNLGINSNFVVDANGGPGVNIALNTLTLNTTAGNTQNTNLIDISSSANNTVTVQTLSAASVVTMNGALLDVDPLKNYLILGNGARSNLVVRDSTGYGWATLVSQNPETPTTLPGNIGRLKIAECAPLTADVDGSNTTSYRLSLAETTGGTLTRTKPLVYGTLSVDTTGGALTLDLGAQTFGDSTANNGRGVLVTGPNDFTLKSTTAMVYSPFIHHYGTGTFTYDVPLNNTFSLITGGTGFINYPAAIAAGDTKIYAEGNVLRLSGTGDLSVSTGTLHVSNGGVLEIGSDLSSSATADFSNAIGGGAGQVRLTSSSGFSAAGTDRVFNFGGAGATLTWGTNYFLTNGGSNVDNDSAFKLSSLKSDATVEIINPIALNLRDRAFDVLNGGDPEDAILRGVISGPGAGISKLGAGTLVLDGQNTYTGVTEVHQGVLRLTKAALADSSTVKLFTGGTLDLSHGATDTISALVVNGSPVANGIYGSAQLPGLITGSGKLNIGGVSGGATPYDTWSEALPAGKRGPEQDADDDGVKNVVEYALGTNGAVANGSVLTKTTGNPAGVSFSRATGRTDITAYLEASLSLTSGSWTTLATSTGGNAYVSATPATFAVTETAAGPSLFNVSVTDSTAPAPAKKFYRVRVTKP